MSVSASLGGLAVLSTCASVHVHAMPLWPALGEYTQMPPLGDLPWLAPSPQDTPTQSASPNFRSNDGINPQPQTTDSTLTSSDTIFHSLQVSLNSSRFPETGSGYETFCSDRVCIGKGQHRRKQGQVNSGSIVDILGFNSTGHGTTWATEYNPKHRRRGTQKASKQAKRKISIIVGLVLVPFLSLFGSVGNIMSLRVLSRMRMRNVINLVLAALAVSDLLFLLHALFFSFLKLYGLRDPTAGARLRALTFPFLGAYSSVVTARITTGLTILLSLERLVAVYFPMKARVMCSRTVTITGIALIYSVTMAVFVPYMLKYRADWYPTLDNCTMRVRLVLTDLGKHPTFFPVYGTVLNTLFRFLPLAVLLVVNVLIAVAIRRTWRLRQTISSMPSAYRCRRAAGAVTSADGSLVGSGGGDVRESGEHNRQTGRHSSWCEQNRITLMLLAVSLVCLVCIMPGAVHSIMAQAWAPHYSRRGEQSNLYDIIRNLSYCLETVNSSVNFIIYIAFSAKFKATYKNMFCCRDIAGGAPSRGSARSVIQFPNRAKHNGFPEDRRRPGSELNTTSSNSRESHPLRQWPR